MLEPVTVYPLMTSASSSPSSQQRLPPITHVTSSLHYHQQPLSSHNMQHHVQTMPQLQPPSSLPPPRQVLPPRVDSMSSVNSSTQGSVEYSTLPDVPLASRQSQKHSTVRRDSSASSSHTNTHQRRRPGGQTKAACLPCRKRKSKVRYFLILRETYSYLSPYIHCFAPLLCSSRFLAWPMIIKNFPLTFHNSAMAVDPPANAAPQKLPCATIASPLQVSHNNKPSRMNWTPTNVF
jgi:hypothetical protein